MSLHPTVSSSLSRTSASSANANTDTQAPYFNETGPIYQKEHVQAKEFVEFVRGHVVVADKNLGKETAWFDWEVFRAAAASLQLEASDISVEYDLAATIPLYVDATPPTPITTTRSNENADNTIQAILDALVTRLASMFQKDLFVPTADSDVADIDATNGYKTPKTHFFDTLRKNLYHAFTHLLQVSDSGERCLSFHRRTHTNFSASPRSAWEYRLLFVHSDERLGIVKGLVMTVTLEGCFEDEEPWYSVSLNSRGQYSGILRAVQVIVGEGFRCP